LKTQQHTKNAKKMQKKGPKTKTKQNTKIYHTNRRIWQQKEARRCNGPINGDTPAWMVVEGRTWGDTIFPS